LEIVQRLNQLRQGSSGNVPSELEMAERLAKLKGLPNDYYINKPSQSVLIRTDNRTDAEKTNDLLSQVRQELLNKIIFTVYTLYSLTLIETYYCLTCQLADETYLYYHSNIFML